MLVKRFGNTSPLVLLALCLGGSVACTKNSTGGSNSSLYEMQESGNQPIPEVTDFSSAERYALANGYYDGSLCKTYLKGGEQVYYSASYDYDEAGQAKGYLQASGDKLYFNQTDMPTSQAMFAPGLGDFSGQSLWEFKRYFKLLCSVAFAKSANGADYDSIKAEKMSMTGGTAGGSVAYNDALKLSLHKSTNGGTSDLVVVLAKGLGPRVMEFRESNMPAGTSKVYIDSSSGGRTPPEQ